jgi:hypothetical protein
MSSTKPYVRSLEDELDWKLLDQLHGAVSQISSFCFEIKKFCITTIFIVFTLLIKLASGKVDHSLFVAGMTIPLCFWFLDSVSYYYQVKLRGIMENIRRKILSRNKDNVITSTTNNFIANDRVDLPKHKLIINSFVNHSMWIYIIIITIDIIAWLMFGFGAIA